MYHKKLLPILISFISFSAFSQSFPMQPISVNDWNLSNSSWKSVESISLFTIEKDLATSGNILFANGKSGKIESKDKFNDLLVSFSFLQSEDAAASIIFQNQFEVLLNGTSSNSAACSIKKKEGNIILPLQNATKAAGLWQKITINYVSSSKAGEMSIIEKVTLNGVIVQENIFLSPNSTLKLEKAPLVLINTVGITAIKDFQYLSQEDKKPVSISNLKYTLQETAEWNTDNKPAAKEPIVKSAKELTVKIPNEYNNFEIAFTGDLEVKEDGKYAFIIDYRGVAYLKIDGKQIAGSDEPMYRKPQLGLIELKAGKHSFEYWFRKAWWRPELGLFVSGGTFKPYALHAKNALPIQQIVDGIFINTEGTEYKAIRSFMNFKNEKRTEVISVASPEKINYAFDLATATLLKAWKGKFADMTEAWFERGEPQVLEPMGMITEFSGKPTFIKSNESPLDSVDVFKDLVFKSYELNSNGKPTFHHNFFGTPINQTFTSSNQGLQVIIKADGPGIKHILASGKKIVKIGKDKYQVDDKYIQWEKGSKANLITKNGIEYLVADIENTLTYIINW